MSEHGFKQAFTIVELLIVIVVIAILATVTIVSYNGISNQAKESSLKSELSTLYKKAELYKTKNGSYPLTLVDLNEGNPLTTNPQNNIVYTGSSESFCVQGVANNKSFYISNSVPLGEGECGSSVASDGDYIQTVTAANCPESRIVVRDARDGRSYFVQKLADGECWMLTSLAYAGGGSNVYGDVKTIQDGSTDTDITYLAPKYYVHSLANATNYPDTPSASTDGGVTNPQYGYLYNWCAAMGAQSGTSACLQATTPAPSSSVSICPAGWRLPSGEFESLNNTVNGGSTTSATGLFSVLLAQMSGRWYMSFTNQGGYGRMWSSVQSNDTGSNVLYFSNSIANPTNVYNKANGLSVRCIAS